MTRTKIIIVVLILCLTGTVIFFFQDDIFRSEYSHIQIPEGLKRMETANAKEDLDIAIQQNDLRTVGIRGYNIQILGIDKKYIHYYLKDSTHVRIINGTSDFIQSKEQERLQGLACQYATEYNILLFQYLKTHNLLPKL